MVQDRAGRPFALRSLELGSQRPGARNVMAPSRGRRLRVETGDRSGLYVRARLPSGPVRDLAVDATLRAAAYHAGAGPAAPGAPGGSRIHRADLREKVRVRRAGAALAFVVDASGSMRQSARMVQTKAAILSLLVSAYTSRDRVALVAFRGVSAEVVLPFTSSVEQARQRLERLPAGGKTPLAEGLRQGLLLTVAERQRHPESLPLLIVVSDGKPNWARHGDPVAAAERLAWRIRQAQIPLLFIDTDRTWHEPGMGQTLTRITRGRYVALDELAAESIVRAVQRAKGSTAGV
ncbi:MAG: VWA domain-containing protein [bacterium]